jgi:queuosine precursor transporter
MPNELLLAFSLVVVFGAALLAYRLFGKAGLFVVSACASILANIEATILINAFGMEQTLGNVLFAVTFLITDILSECETKKDAQLAVWLGVFASAFFLVLNQSWLQYTPSPNDGVMDSVQVLFGSTPRLLLASLTVYAISQAFDVWLYHKWWGITTKLTGDKRSHLWLRNTGSTLISQIVNTLLFTLFAFWGTYDVPTLISVFLSSYIIYIGTSILDTPCAYIARRMKESGKIGALVKAADADKKQNASA